MSSDFKPGMQVVWIGPDVPTQPLREVGDFPSGGVIYTIRDIGIQEFQSGIKPGVNLEGLTRRWEVKYNNVVVIRHDIFWLASNFRPLVSHGSNIEIFRSLVAGGDIEDQGSHLDKRKVKV